MKYIIAYQPIPNSSLCNILYVTFSENIVHSAMFWKIGELAKQQWPSYPPPQALSAGFINDVNGNHYGKSESMGVGSNYQDTIFIYHARIMNWVVDSETLEIRYNIKIC